jgi:hypothetical protein
LLCRFGELGVRIQAGQLQFDRALMHAEEFLTEPAVFEYVDVAQQTKTIELDANSLVYTVCQVPVVHQRGEQESIEVSWNDGRTTHVQGLALDFETSRKIFRRLHEVVQLTVTA